MDYLFIGILGSIIGFPEYSLRIKEYFAFYGDTPSIYLDNCDIICRQQ